MSAPAGLECPNSSRFAELVSDLQAQDVMLCGVTGIDRKRPIHRAVSLMLPKNVTSLPVVDQGSLIGILSDKDLLRSFYEVRYLPGKVEDYMTDNITTFDVEDRFSDICQCLIKNSFRQVPILCQGKLAGVITRSDLIRTFLKNNRSHHPVDQGHELIAENAMTCGLLTLRPEASLVEAMEMTTIHDITGIPIVSPTLELLGIITEKDLLQAIDRPDVLSATVEAYMTRRVIAFERKSRVGAICECLLKYDFHQVPIVDQNTLVGIINRSDILKMRIKSFKSREA